MGAGDVRSDPERIPGSIAGESRFIVRRLSAKTVRDNGSPEHVERAGADATGRESGVNDRQYSSHRLGVMVARLERLRKDEFDKYEKIIELAWQEELKKTANDVEQFLRP